MSFRLLLFAPSSTATSPAPETVPQTVDYSRDSRVAYDLEARVLYELDNREAYPL